MEWLEFHNGRMNSENYNKELKEGLNAGYAPSHDFNTDRFYFLLNVLALQCVAGHEALLFGPGSEELDGEDAAVLVYWSLWKDRADGAEVLLQDYQRDRRDVCFIPELLVAVADCSLRRKTGGGIKKNSWTLSCGRIF